MQVENSENSTLTQMIVVQATFTFYTHDQDISLAFHCCYLTNMMRQVA